MASGLWLVTTMSSMATMAEAGWTGGAGTEEDEGRLRGELHRLRAEYKAAAQAVPAR